MTDFSLTKLQHVSSSTEKVDFRHLYYRDSVTNPSSVSTKFSLRELKLINLQEYKQIRNGEPGTKSKRVHEKDSEVNYSWHCPFN